MNEFQKLLAEHYGNGDFSYVEMPEQAEDVGDSLFSFLMIEFSDSEGCEDRETALSRIDTIINDMLVIQNRLEDLT